MYDAYNLCSWFQLRVLYIYNRIVTCMESVLIISPLNLLPISSANFDFPVPVAPRIKITGTRKGAFMEAAIFE